MTTRRSFIKAGSLLTAGAVFKKDLFFDDRIDKIGLQLYTLRDIIKNDVTGVMSKIASIGFKEVEVYGYTNENKFWGMQPKEFKRVLDSNGLAAPSSHILFEKFFTGDNEDEIKRVCEDANIIGNEFIVFPILNEPYRKNINDYKILTDKLNAAGKIVKSSGLQFAYHNHDFEFITMEDGNHGYDIILNNTDKDLVKLELDLYWAIKAGQDPVKIFERDPGRFVMWHVKDMDKTTRSFTEVGTGAINFKRIFRSQERSGVKHVFIEQDIIKGDLFKSIRQSFEYVKSKVL